MAINDNPVVIIHGLWLHATSWAPWMELYAAAGYETTAPGWPGEPPAVAESRVGAEAVADNGIEDVTNHYRQVISTLSARRSGWGTRSAA